MSELAQIVLMLASVAYFWTVMFERFTRSCTAIAGVILVGTSGAVLLPEQRQFFEAIALTGIAALLFARTWIIWKEWYRGS